MYIYINELCKLDTWSIGKNEPKTNPILANKTPIRTQTNPILRAYYKQMTNQLLTKLFVDSLLPILSFKGREVVDKQMLSWYCSARTVPQYLTEVYMKNKANDHP